jgi:predicted AAA+ superfamily ATPase
LEETFLIKRVKPFFTNKNKEISKAPKIYFVDNGVRNYFIKNFIEDIELR